MQTSRQEALVALHHKCTYEQLLEKASRIAEDIREKYMPTMDQHFHLSFSPHSAPSQVVVLDEQYATVAQHRLNQLAKRGQSGEADGLTHHDPGHHDPGYRDGGYRDGGYRDGGYGDGYQDQVRTVSSDFVPAPTATMYCGPQHEDPRQYMPPPGAGHSGPPPQQMTPPHQMSPQPDPAGNAKNSPLAALGLPLNLPSFSSIFGQTFGSDATPPSTLQMDGNIFGMPNLWGAPSGASSTGPAGGPPASGFGGPPSYGGGLGAGEQTAASASTGANWFGGASVAPPASVQQSAPPPAAGVYGSPMPQAPAYASNMGPPPMPQATYGAAQGAHWQPGSLAAPTGQQAPMPVGAEAFGGQVAYRDPQSYQTGQPAPMPVAADGVYGGQAAYRDPQSYQGQMYGGTSPQAVYGSTSSQPASYVTPPVGAAAAQQLHMAPASRSVSNFGNSLVGAVGMTAPASSAMSLMTTYASGAVKTHVNAYASGGATGAMPASTGATTTTYTSPVTAMPSNAYAGATTSYASPAAVTTYASPTVSASNAYSGAATGVNTYVAASGTGSSAMPTTVAYPQVRHYG